MFLFVELIVWAIVCLIFVAYDKGVGASIVTVGAGVVACFVAGVNPVMWLWANPMIALTYIAVYAGAGLIWSTIKWASKLRKARNMYIKDKSEFIAGGGLEQAFISQVRNSYRMESYAPSVNKNKANFGFWCMWWPFSMIAFLCEDLIRELWNFSWKFLTGFFGGMRKRILGEASRDLD